MTQTTTSSSEQFTGDPVARARRYVSDAPIPAARRGAADEPPVKLALDSTKDQAAVVGSDVISFVTGVTAERREAIINSSMLAQLVAMNKVPDRDKIEDWYKAYFDVLLNIGWVVQNRDFAEYKERTKNFETHKAILAVASVVFGAAPAALALVTTTLEALHKMNEDSPWITLFNRHSQTAQAARFQITLVEQKEEGQFSVSLMAFTLKAQQVVTQVLFFRALASDVTLRHASGQVTINTTVLDGIRAGLKEKITNHANDYLKQLPDLN
jgi:hypothetical protein